jgi:diadenosine tetraphosphatase ApaH/serine/threonine PP2A family protein phosphatase
MKRALISDIYANLAALHAVLADIRAQEIAEVYCLGDIVGFGSHPNECLDEVMANCQVAIMGDCDQAVLFDPDGMHPDQLAAMHSTREQLENGPGGREAIERRWQFLGDLRRVYDDGDYRFVHGSPRRPTNEYVFPEDIYNQRKMDALFGRVRKYCFQGHSLLPGVFTPDYRFVTPEKCNYQYRLGADRAMVNVGSVGLPRDGDPRACYAVLEDDLVTFRRVASSNDSS